MATTAELYELIVDAVRGALGEPDHSMRMTEIRDAGAAAFAIAYEDAGGDPDRYTRAEMEFMNTLTSAATHTFPDGTDEQTDRVASILATAAANAATVAAAPAGTELQWITMLDDRVRDLHRPLHGEVRAAGTPFIVGGVPLTYPGQPVGPPEGWINCRCTLHPATLVAREFSTEKRRKMAKEHTAMPDGSYPIANAEDLRNAIQAIGRAKDPDKVKAHIKRRAKALGLSDLIPESWTASGEFNLGPANLDSEVANASPDALVAGPTSNPSTHDAPGWITNPRETQRLRDYWTKGEGALKIRWGQPGDFDRCRRQLVKYVQNPEHLAGTCANLHFVALGFWPNQGPHKGKHHRRVADGCAGCEDFDPENMTPEGATVTAAFAAIAELDEMRPPREWFADPGFAAVTPLTVTDEGEVYGHIGTWDQCHVGFGEDNCVPPPHSTRDYHHFRTGYVATAGGDVAVGNLTLGTGHADDGIGAGAAIAHYDDTGTAVADVAAGEDAHGIWVHGMLRPGVTAAQVHALRAGTPSGDWRTIGGQYEMVAALIVNVPGFPIPRPHETLAADGRPLSLVAAGLVVTDPNAADTERIAVAVTRALDERDRRAANRARVAALNAQVNEVRVEALTAALR